MKKSRFTESQIVAILKEGEAGVPTAELVRKHGISRGTYFNWRSKYSGVSVSELKKMKEQEAENEPDDQVDHRGRIETRYLDGPRGPHREEGDQQRILGGIAYRLRTDQRPDDLVDGACQ